MKSKISIAGGLAAAILLVGTTTATAADAAKPRSQRGQLAYEIVRKWGDHVQEAYRTDVRQWARSLGPSFANAPIASLERAANARTFDAMNNALLAKAGANAAASNVTPQALGDAAADLVYVPVEPCRLFDTRLAGGAIAAGGTRGFDVSAVSDYSFQGGSASNCGGVGAAGSFAAAVINFTWVAPSQTGYFTAYPFGGTQPLAATAIYGAGQIASNLAVVKLDQGASANELTIFAERQLHLVADIVGYYIAPAPTALDCVELEGTALNLAAGASGNAFAPACTAGYTAVEVQCRPSTFSVRQAGSWSSHCNVHNEGASAATVTAASRCCRVPGR